MGKLLHLRKVATKLGIYGHVGVKLNTDCSIVRAEHIMEELIKSKNNVHMVTGHSTTEHTSLCQQCSTNVVLFEWIAPYDTKCVIYSICLGICSSIPIKVKYRQKTRVASA